MLGRWSSTTVIAAAAIVIGQQLVYAASAPDCTNNQSNGTTYIGSANGVYDIVCGIDFFDGDLVTLQAASLAECIDTCDKTANCVAVSFRPNGDLCYLKRFLSPGVASANVWSAKKHIGSPVLSCLNGESNGTIYQAAHGKFQILCGVDYNGGELGLTQAVSFTECLDACDATPGCIDVSYIGPGTACYMKNKLYELRPDGSVWTGLLLSAAPANTSSSTSSSASAGVPSSTSSSTASGSASGTASGTSSRTSGSSTTTSSTASPSASPNVAYSSTKTLRTGSLYLLTGWTVSLVLRDLV